MSIDSLSTGYRRFDIQENARLRRADEVMRDLRLREQEVPEEKAPEIREAAIEQVPVERGNQDPREIAEKIRPAGSDPFGEIYGAVHTKDMAQAISGMQKDDMLREYQYFVGSANRSGAADNGIAWQDEDGLVRRID
ncbi:MAG: hypothetical protein IK096_03655 [Lachnospiraceae bacterium]|nr:hypothetical protein [Lachnospiraceae bacterium]